MSETAQAPAERASPNRLPEPPAPGTVSVPPARASVQPPGEIGGPSGPEPTRYGDWERGGRCTDF
ncbi:MAG: DUF1674 domain-containing protein [Geminicoccaceae bacterium]|nr:DUF1674 domain-containing protein [Geminicoccaceae bacterium]